MFFIDYHYKVISNHRFVIQSYQQDKFINKLSKKVEDDSAYHVVDIEKFDSRFEFNF